MRRVFREVGLAEEAVAVAVVRVEDGAELGGLVIHVEMHPRVVGTGEGDVEAGVAGGGDGGEVEVDAPFPIRGAGGGEVAGVGVVPIGGGARAADGVFERVRQFAGELLVEVGREVIVAVTELARIAIGGADLPGEPGAAAGDVPAQRAEIEGLAGGDGDGCGVLVFAGGSGGESVERVGAGADVGDGEGTIGAGLDPVLVAL